MTEINPALAPLIRHLHAEGRLRVWSLIVSILGEVAQPEGGQIAMADVLKICSALNIEPQAVRTAMSRLSKEGLVQGRKQGRIALYAFSSKGKKEYETAARVIYAKPRQIKTWIYAVPPPAMSRARLDEISGHNPMFEISGSCYAWPSEYGSSIKSRAAGELILFNQHPDTLPDWAQSTAMTRLNFETCTILLESCSELSLRQLSMNDARVARVLIVHFWRRLALRYPLIEAPSPLQAWPLSATHRAICAVYPHLVMQTAAEEIGRFR